jgi:hypothetical protein
MFCDCLWEYKRTHSTGEWIVSGDGEVHLFFVAGLLAWGTSTMSKRAFSGYLIRQGYASPEQIREAIVEARQTGEPFGQRLKALGRCTDEMLREAARFQLGAALRDAERLLAEGRQQLFLDRTDHPWTPKDCFELSTFLIEPQQYRELVERFTVEVSACPHLEQLALIHVTSAIILANRGAEFRDIAHASAELMRALRLLAQEETTATVLMTSSPGSIRLFRCVSDTIFVVAIAPKGSTTLGMAHLELESLTDTLSRSVKQASP